LERAGDVPRHLLAKMLADTPTLVGHNLRFDIQKLLMAEVLVRQDVTPERLEDTATLSHLLDEHRPKKLKGLAVELLGVDDTIEVEVKSGPNKGKLKAVSREKYELDAVRRKLKVKLEDGYGVLPREVVIPYALKDTEFTLGIWHLLKPKVDAVPDLASLYRLEMELLLAVLDMEANAMAVDMEYVDAKVKELGGTILRLEREIGQLVGTKVGKDAKAGEFNPASRPQLMAVFTDRLGYVLESTDEEHLAKVDDPLAALITEWRGVSKLRTTYFLAMKREAQDVDGRCLMHPNFNTTGTITGRFSSSKGKGD
jgi:DNA polymerase I-like protein with 3'-5' exonuclease and polymerase domains